MDVFLALLDILGFKDLIERNSHEELKEIFEVLIIPDYELTMTINAFKRSKIGNKTIYTPDRDNIRLNSTLISDSLIFWTDNVSMKSFFWIIAAIRSLMSRSIAIGIPLRGAITIGPIYHQFGIYETDLTNSYNILIGKSIVDAYNLEKRQNWSGCIIDKKCIEKYRSQIDAENLATVEDLITKKIICKYNVPFKNGRFSNEYVIDWVHSDKSILKESHVQDSFSMHNKDIENPNTRRKITNTLKFYKLVSNKKSD